MNNFSIDSREEDGGLKSRIRRCKVPQVTKIFWVIKCACTTVGETLSDTFNVDLNFGLGGAAGLFFPILALLLLLQFRARQYHPLLYWICVIFMSICGTIGTDGLHDDAGIENWIQIIMWGTLMTGTFYAWYRVEGTIDIHSIDTIRREMFYWLTVFFTFAVGTAAGDAISESAGLGYGATLGIFIGVLGFIFLVWLFSKFFPSPYLDEVTLFWFAYIMTRPLGAAFGDLLSQDDQDGLGFGTGPTSGVFTAIILVLVAWLTYSKIDQIEVHDTVNPTSPTMGLIPRKYSSRTKCDLLFIEANKI